MTDIEPELVLAAARATLGTPYVHQGRINGMALDCIGVAQFIAASLKLPHFDQRAYPMAPYQGLLEAVLDAQPCLRRVYDRKPGDLLLMRFTDDPQHIAVFTGDGIIHCYRNSGRVVEHVLDAAWEARIVRMYRFIQPD